MAIATSTSATATPEPPITNTLWNLPLTLLLSLLSKSTVRDPLLGRFIATFVSAELILPSPSMAATTILRSPVTVLVVLKPTVDRASSKVSTGKLSTRVGERVSLISPSTNSPISALTVVGREPKRLSINNESPSLALVTTTSILARLLLSSSRDRSKSAIGAATPPKVKLLWNLPPVVLSPPKSKSITGGLSLSAIVRSSVILVPRSIPPEGLVKDKDRVSSPSTWLSSTIVKVTLPVVSPSAIIIRSSERL